MTIIILTNKYSLQNVTNRIFEFPIVDLVNGTDFNSIENKKIFYKNLNRGDQARLKF